MEEWKEYKLGELCNIFTGKKDVKQTTPKGSYPFFSCAPTPYRSSDYIFDGKAIIVAGNGSFTGRVSYYIGKFDLYQRTYACVPISEACDFIYLYYYMKAIFEPEFMGGTRGSSIPYIVKGDLADFKVLTPSLNKQRQIACILKSFDEKIKLNRRINDNIENQAQALFKSWFVDFEPFKDGEFVASELGMIPKGWKVVDLDNLCSFISRGLTPKYNDLSDEFILGQTCVRNNIVTLDNARKHLPKVKNEKWVKQWDVLINSTGVGSLGRVGIVYFNKDNVAIDSHITVVRAKSSLLLHYIGRNLLSRQLEIENMAVGSTGQTELPRDRVKAMPIISPDNITLERFNNLIEPMTIAMYRIVEENRRLAELRDTLLPRLMSGELKVNEIEKIA